MTAVRHPAPAGQGAAEKRVAERLQQLGTAVLDLQMAEIANACGTSEATVVRCCRRLGYAGLKDYKIAVARGDTARKGEADTCLRANEHLSVMKDKVFSGCSTVLESTAAALNEKDLLAAVRSIASAHHIDIYAYGGSVPLASYLRHKLMMLGIRSTVCGDSEAMQLSTSVLRREDTVIAISASGRTGNVTGAIAEAHRLGACTITMTTDPESPAAHESDICLLTASSPFTENDGSTYTRLAQLALIDLLYAALAFRCGQEGKEEA